MQKKTEFESFSEHDIRQLNKLNLLTHDLGKATSYFQDYIRNLDDNTQKNDERKRHGLLSGVLSFKIVNAVMKNEILAFYLIWWFQNIMVSLTILQILYL